jgi:hypothetical protein
VISEWHCKHASQVYDVLDAAYNHYTSFCSTWEELQRDKASTLTAAYKADIGLLVGDPLHVRQLASSVPNQHALVHDLLAMGKAARDKRHNYVSSLYSEHYKKFSLYTRALLDEK